MRKPASAEYPILDVIAERWSPKAFDASPVAAEQLHSLFEAARWAASCFNEQPWAFLVARREDGAAFERALSCLVEKNRAWARSASALIFACARREFARNARPNPHAAHDLGQAAAHLALQAVALGLAVHQMAGFSADAARDAFGIPEGWDALTAIAVGRPLRAEDLDEEQRRSESVPRTRKPQSEFVFESGWGGARNPGPEPPRA